MARVRRGVTKHRRHKKVLDAASGYRGSRSRHFRPAKEQLLHSLTYSYRDRRDRKGEFRRLWITRISAAARGNGISYSRFMQGLNQAGIEVDRKMLAEVALTDPEAFTSLAEAAKQNVSGS